jgi:hypothetical protein
VDKQILVEDAKFGVERRRAPPCGRACLLAQSSSALDANAIRNVRGTEVG